MSKDLGLVLVSTKTQVGILLSQILGCEYTYIGLYYKERVYLAEYERLNFYPWFDRKSTLKKLKKSPDVDKVGLISIESDCSDKEYMICYFIDLLSRYNVCSYKDKLTYNCSGISSVSGKSDMELIDMFIERFEIDCFERFSSKPAPLILPENKINLAILPVILKGFQRFGPQILYHNKCQSKNINKDERDDIKEILSAYTDLIEIFC